MSKVESDKEKAFRLMNTTLFRTAVINKGFFNLDLDDEATRNEFLRIAEDPISLRYFEEMVFVRRIIPPFIRFRNNGDPEGNHWNTSAPSTQQNPSTSNHNVQPSASNTVQTVPSAPTTNSNYPSTSNSYVQPTNSYVQLNHQTVSSAPATNYSGPNASNYPSYYMQPTSSDNYAPGPMPQTHMGVLPNGYPNGLVPPHYVISDPMNHQYRQPAPPPYGPVPYGMMVQYPQQNMFPNGMVAPNNTQTGSYYNVHHQPRPSHFPNHVGYNRGRGSYGSRPPRGDRKPWSSRELEFQRPVESYNLGLVKLNVYDAEDHTNQSRQMSAMVHGASQIADLEKQIGSALDKAFAAYPDAPIKTVAQLKERKDDNGAELQQNGTNTVARVVTPAFSEISSRALSTASPTVPTADENPRNGEGSSPSTAATVLTQENLPAASKNEANASETEPVLQETPVPPSSSFRDAVLKNRTDSSKSMAPLRSDVPSKGTTVSNVNISTKRSNATKNARNADKVSKQAVAQKTGRTQTNRGQRKKPVPSPAPAPTTTSTVTESNASVAQIVKKKPPPPVLFIKNKFSQLSTAQEEEDKESADVPAPDTTDEKKVVVAPRPPRKPKSHKKKEGKASGKAKKRQKQNKDSDAVAAEKKEDNNEAEPEKKTLTVSFASEEEVFEFERSENAEEAEENEQVNDVEGNDGADIGMMNGSGEGREGDGAAEEPDTVPADAEEEELDELIRLAKKNSELNKAQEKDENGVGEKQKKAEKSKSKKEKQSTKEAENETATQLAIPEKSRSRFYVERVEEPVPPEPTTSAVDYANSAINRYQSCVSAPPGIRLASCGGTDAETLATLRSLSIESISNPIAVMIGSDTWEKQVERQVRGRLMYFSKFVDHKLTEKVIPEWVGNIPFLDPKEKAHKRRERDQKVKGFLKRQANRTNEKYINYIGYTMMWFYRTLAKTYTTSMGPTFFTVALLESKGAEFEVEEWRLMKLILDNPNNENYGRIALNHAEFMSPESASLF